MGMSAGEQAFILFERSLQRALRGSDPAAT